MTKKILWMRRLSCNHERPTSVAYLMKNYDKPIVGNHCFCRVCNENVKIIEVYEIKVKEINNKIYTEDGGKENE